MSGSICYFSLIDDLKSKYETSSWILKQWKALVKNQIWKKVMKQTTLRTDNREWSSNFIMEKISSILLRPRNYKTKDCHSYTITKCDVWAMNRTWKFDGKMYAVQKIDAKVQVAADVIRKICRLWEVLGCVTYSHVK